MRFREQQRNKHFFIKVVLLMGCMLLLAGCDKKGFRPDTSEKREITSEGAAQELEGHEEDGPGAAGGTEQIQMIAAHGKEWLSEYGATSYYAVTDLDQNGDLELLVSTGEQGTGRFTYSTFYLADMASGKLKKCSMSYGEASEDDIVDGIHTVYHDTDTGEYHYITCDFASAGGAADNIYSVDSLTLLDDRVSSQELGYRMGIWKKKKQEHKYSYYQYTKKGKEQEISGGITSDGFTPDQDYFGDRAYPKCEKMSVNIHWISSKEMKKALRGKENPTQEETAEKIYPLLEQSYKEFWLGYGLRQTKMKMYGYSVQIPQLVNMEDQDKQERLNEMIRKEVRKDFSWRSPKERKKSGEANIWEYKGIIKYAGRDSLSILVIAEGMWKGAVHPAGWSYTVNLDLEKERKIPNREILPEKYYKDMEKYILDGMGREIRNVGYLELCRKLGQGLLGEYQEWKEIDVYRTPDHIGVAIPISHAAGDYAIFEVSQSTLF